MSAQKMPLEELDPDDFPSVAPLFEGLAHNVALVYGVIERYSEGRIFVDRQAAPRCALIMTDVGYFYVGGSPDQAAFNRALGPLFFETLLPLLDEPELIVFAFSDSWRARLDELLQPYGAIVIHRKVFRFVPSQFAAHAGWQTRIPAGCDLRLIDKTLADQHPALQRAVAPGAQRFGVCLMRGEELLSVCIAVSVGGGEAEIDIHTEAVHRGKGFGFLTACAFIETCLARGLTPSWTCWPHREASQALAKKLGFAPLPDAPAHLWAKDM
ncbi:MAG: GNAT family N-acetyltransferase [Anaerolineae bacterium]|nr:GNAT family N-acetyltransferase [Anaerolineae bacterium]